MGRHASFAFFSLFFIKKYVKKVVSQRNANAFFIIQKLLFNYILPYFFLFFLFLNTNVRTVFKK